MSTLRERVAQMAREWRDEFPLYEGGDSGCVLAELKDAEQFGLAVARAVLEEAVKGINSLETSEIDDPLSPMICETVVVLADVHSELAQLRADLEQQEDVAEAAGRSGEGGQS